MAYESSLVISRISSSVAAGGFVFVSGQVAFDAPHASLFDQSREIFGRIEAELGRHGTNKSRLVMVTCFVAGIDMFAEMDRAWAEWIDPTNPPARYTVASGPASHLYRIEIAAQALL